jgi:hypothetical protein
VTDDRAGDAGEKSTAPSADTAGRDTRTEVRTGTNALRSRLATVTWLVAVTCALFLAIGALLIALKADEENSIVRSVISGAEGLDGPFSLDRGIFTFPETQDGRVKSALTNWGIAAVVYLVIGKLLDRIIRP